MAQTENPDGRMKQVIDEPPPFLGSWPRVYALVLCWLAVVIALFYGFTRAYAP